MAGAVVLGTIVDLYSGCGRNVGLLGLQTGAGSGRWRQTATVHDIYTARDGSLQQRKHGKIQVGMDSAEQKFGRKSVILTPAEVVACQSSVVLCMLGTLIGVLWAPWWWW